MFPCTDLSWKRIFVPVGFECEPVHCQKVWPKNILKTFNVWLETIKTFNLRSGLKHLRKINLRSGLKTFNLRSGLKSLKQI